MNDEVPEQSPLLPFYAGYKGITSPLVEALRIFRHHHAPKQHIIAGRAWRYYEAGERHAPALLLLPSGGGDAELNFSYVMGFGQFYRVIAPDMPESIKTVEEAVAGLYALLDELAIEQAYLVGMGWGAQLAQIFVRRYPDKVNGAIFAHATIPNELDGERVRMQRNFMRMYPPFLLRIISLRAIGRAITQAPMLIEDADRAFWRAYYTEMFGKRWGRHNLLSRARLSLNFHEHHRFDARDALQLEHDILIIESTGDDVVTEGERGSLKTMYPSAYVQTLEGYTHIAPILCGDAYLQSMTNFFQKAEPDNL